MPLLFVSLVGLWSCSCSDEKSSTQSDGDTQVATSHSRQLTVEEAEALLQAKKGKGGNCLESFKPYQENNALFLDSDAPCNQGSESLRAFVEKFATDSAFQESRIRRPDPTLAIPEIKADSFKIQEPDQNGFFASWHEIEADYASFCTGWLNSEMEQEFVFERLDDGPWYLTDYIGPM